MVGISYSGENKAVARFCTRPARWGLTVALTNYKLSPVAKGSDVALVTSFREPSIQNFELCALSQLLVVHAHRRRGERLSQRAGRNERYALTAVRVQSIVLEAEIKDRKEGEMCPCPEPIARRVCGGFGAPCGRAGPGPDRADHGNPLEHGGCKAPCCSSTSTNTTAYRMRFISR